MFERFTDRARKVMSLANMEAQRLSHGFIGTEHILLGIIKEGSGVGSNVLRNLGASLSSLRTEVEKLVKPGPEMVTMGKLPQSPHAKKVIEYALEASRSLNHNYVGTEHLLLGICKEPEGIARKVLTNVFKDINRAEEEVRAETLGLLGFSESKVPDVLQSIPAEGEVVVPFSFRFIERGTKIELLDGTGAVTKSIALDGSIGAYIFNALRKHEASQALLRDVHKLLSGLNELGVTYENLLKRITRLLDSGV